MDPSSRDSLKGTVQHSLSCCHTEAASEDGRKSLLLARKSSLTHTHTHTHTHTLTTLPAKHNNMTFL